MAIVINILYQTIGIALWGGADVVVQLCISIYDTCNEHWNEHACAAIPAAYYLKVIITYLCKWLARGLKRRIGLIDSFDYFASEIFSTYNRIIQS